MRSPHPALAVLARRVSAAQWTMESLAAADSPPTAARLELEELDVVACMALDSIAGDADHSDALGNGLARLATAAAARSTAPLTVPMPRRAPAVAPRARATGGVSRGGTARAPAGPVAGRRPQAFAAAAGNVRPSRSPDSAFVARTLARHAPASRARAGFPKSAAGSVTVEPPVVGPRMPVAMARSSAVVRLPAAPLTPAAWLDAIERRTPLASSRQPVVVRTASEVGVAPALGGQSGAAPTARSNGPLSAAASLVARLDRLSGESMRRPLRPGSAVPDWPPFSPAASDAAFSSRPSGLRRLAQLAAGNTAGDVSPAGRGSTANVPARAAGPAADAMPQGSLPAADRVLAGPLLDAELTARLGRQLRREARRYGIPLEDD